MPLRFPDRLQALGVEVQWSQTDSNRTSLESAFPCLSSSLGPNTN